jgi:hypothetical protein
LLGEGRAGEEKIYFGALLLLQGVSCEERQFIVFVLKIFLAAAFSVLEGVCGWQRG